MVLDLRISPQVLKKGRIEKLISRHVTMKVFGNPIFQEKLDLIDVNVKRTENNEILIENKV